MQSTLGSHFTHFLPVWRSGRIARYIFFNLLISFCFFAFIWINETQAAGPQHTYIQTPEEIRASKAAITPVLPKHLAGLSKKQRATLSPVMLSALNNGKIRPSTSEDIQRWETLATKKKIANNRITPDPGRPVLVIVKPFVPPPTPDSATSYTCFIVSRGIAVPPDDANVYYDMNTGGWSGLGSHDIGKGQHAGPITPSTR